eukprot:TRINITY_DN1669_c0_g1_i3.p1 TRINITY_DN1669_c0_g1~~TRINITY_DN1669_c0_g1_i3.p1  ORF type:complete len:351 (+),score=83.56 TRINITY_DN1669_c0_g1_i3:495-1547(+)
MLYSVPVEAKELSLHANKENSKAHVTAPLYNSSCQPPQNAYPAVYYHTPTGSGIRTETTTSEEALGSSGRLEFGSEMYSPAAVSGGTSPLSYQLRSSEQYVSGGRLMTPPIAQTESRLHRSFEFGMQTPSYSSMSYLYSGGGYDAQVQPYFSDSYWKDSYFYPEVPKEMEKSGSYDSLKCSFSINLYDILSKKDTRTTIMIKNIPNKYTQSMLLKKINKKFKDLYDFFYLPIDFKNKCNVGYAFINFTNSFYILQFFEAFNASKWEKFKSEKICQLAYARIQGTQALMAHFKAYDNLFQYSQKVRPLILLERKLSEMEVKEYEKRMRRIMNEERIKKLIELNESVFGPAY